MREVYVCQICNHIAFDNPPEWCDICGGHRVIFMRKLGHESHLMTLVTE